jgi:hypothetical protein
MFVVGDRVKLTPPRAFITEAEAWDEVAVVKGQAPVRTLRVDVLGDGTPNADGLIEIRTVDPNGSHPGADLTGEVITVGPDVPGGQRRYEVGTRQYEYAVSTRGERLANGAEGPLITTMVMAWESFWTDEDHLTKVPG